MSGAKSPVELSSESESPSMYPRRPSDDACATSDAMRVPLRPAPRAVSVAQSTSTQTSRATTCRKRLAASTRRLVESRLALCGTRSRSTGTRKPAVSVNAAPR
eukprot:3342619-Prymnesium_polylepis.1